ncbi:MAG TPA: class II histone deacetylase [Spongiibacteraceae bacterium]|nr:class II histone deacetylase [Spongiibacteraceae bacterium]HUH38893.1 class II histone deacetylase [Spongiibacteraceae bacterium]
MKTGIVWDERYMWYDFGSYASIFNESRFIQPGTSAETPESKRRILNLLSAAGLLDKLEMIAPQAASKEELALVHDTDYIDRVAAISAAQGGYAGSGLPMPCGGFDIAALAAGGTRAAIDAVLNRTVRNAYALVRPPGHHAEKETGMALCVFSNIAVAVKSAMLQHGLQRVAIIDWDAHHGNGTESAFYSDPSVLTISIHQDQMIYGRGLVDHCGEGKGRGYNINIPLPPGSGTGAYLAAFERVIVPAVNQFRPELIVVASGLDAGFSDPTARMLLHSESFRLMTRYTMDMAARLCEGRLVLSHEGGYDPTVTPFLALAIFEELSGLSSAVRAEDNPFEGPYTGFLVDEYQALSAHQDTFIQRAETLLQLLPA